MLSVVLVVGILLMLLKDINAIAFSHTWSVIIAVVCLAIAIIGAGDYVRGRFS